MVSSLILQPGVEQITRDFLRDMNTAFALLDANKAIPSELTARLRESGVKGLSRKKDDV